jgi:hypothetical protein
LLLQVLAALNGGRIDLHGIPATKRWTRLSTSAAANARELLLADSQLGWRAGQRLLVASTTFNPSQAEIRQITAVEETAEGVTRVTLDLPLTFAHTAKLKRYAGRRQPHSRPCDYTHMLLLARCSHTLPTT